MANQLVLQTFSVALPAAVQTFRPGDVVLDTDPNFAAITAAAPSPSGLAAFPLSVVLEAAAIKALQDRAKAVPDDIVQTNLLAAAAAPVVP